LRKVFYKLEPLPSAGRVIIATIKFFVPASVKIENIEEY
jgi:hypothetical protein